MNVRLGSPLPRTWDSAAGWIAAVQRHGFRAAYWPLGDDADAETVDAYAAAAASADVVIAEIGAWNNPLSPDERTRATALKLCKRRLELADRVGARCCVNIAGSRADSWYAPHPDDLSRETFALIVDTVREIVDAVEPQRTFYSLEPMPWSPPDSPDSYLELIGAVERRQFGVHLDPVNLVNSPAKYYDDAGLLRDCFAKLGPHIKSCHAKDVTLANELTVHLAEVRRHVGVDAQRPRAARVVVVGVHEHVVDRAGGAGEQGHAPEEARQPPHVLILKVGPGRPLVYADREHRRHAAPVLRDPEAHAAVARRVLVGDVRRVDGDRVDDVGVGGAP
jgi:sugar phosphate isomerase/epimerase